MPQESVVVRKEEMQELLAQAPAPGKHGLEPFKSFAKARGLPFIILEDTDVINDAEAHMHEGDVWLCLEGEVTFRYGGELVHAWPKQNPDGTTDTRELKAKEIRNGTDVILKPGDWLWIPSGVPHQHRTKGTARLVIIKIPSVHALTKGMKARIL